MLRPLPAHTLQPGVLGIDLGAQPHIQPILKYPVEFSGKKALLALVDFAVQQAVRDLALFLG